MQETLSKADDHDVTECVLLAVLVQINIPTTRQGKNTKEIQEESSEEINFI